MGKGVGASHSQEKEHKELTGLICRHIMHQKVVILSEND